MSRIKASLLLLAALGLSAWAAPVRADEPLRPAGQIALLPLAPGPHDDLEVLLQAFWKDYYNTGILNGFGRENLRVGRTDLDGDGYDELVMMITAVGWENDHGYPFVVAQWRKGRWIAVGWGSGDEDTVFSTTEAKAGWRTIDTGTELLRWDGKQYREQGRGE